MTETEIRTALESAKEAYAAGTLSDAQLETELKRLAVEKVALTTAGDLYDRVGAAVGAGLRAFFSYGK